MGLTEVTLGCVCALSWNWSSMETTPGEACGCGRGEKKHLHGYQLCDVCGGCVPCSLASWWRILPVPNASFPAETQLAPGQLS